MESPAFGYGRWQQPLHTQRDRDAETIRKALRKAGCPEFRHPGDGFYVDGGHDDGPFLVGCASRTRHRRLSPAAQLAAYTMVLTAAGMLVEPQTGPEASASVLHVRLP